MTDISIYMASTFWVGMAPGQPEYRKLSDPFLIDIADKVPHRLESFHYVGKGKRLSELKASGMQVFLDSGAFSAWTLGAKIDIVDYCNYIKENKSSILHEDGVLLASVLDGIGDPLLTYQNQMAMQAQGVTPLPCFHFGEDEQYLEWYVQNYPYITIGGCVGRHPKDLFTWLDRIWSKHILDARGNPKCKVHGFGITSIPIMERYPWWSVDSTSWLQTASFGAITFPGYGSLHVSKDSPSRHDKGAHLNSLSAVERERVVNTMKAQGFDPDYIIDHYLGRFTYNLFAYREIEKALNANKTQKAPMTMELW
jgi:hypothetical protein